jgi:hypothetical protein
VRSEDDPCLAAYLASTGDHDEGEKTRMTDAREPKARATEGSRCAPAWGAPGGIYQLDASKVKVRMFFTPWLCGRVFFTSRNRGISTGL